MRLALLLLLTSAVVAFAQKSDDKERLIFQPGAKEPNAAPPAASPTPRKLDAPAEKLDLFFLALKAGQVDAAYTMIGPLLKRSNPQGFLITGGYMLAPVTRPMRADPRFLPLMRETGIYQYWLDTRTQPEVCETPEERDFEVCLALRKDQRK
jgi:hypothetical protein